MGLARSKQLRLKRLADVFCAGSGLVVLSPLLCITATTILTTMGSPVLFRQKRPGLRGMPFTLIKFRTMVVDTNDAGVASDGARLTVLGKLLRRLSLDELPTLWNVVVGDMSLVGPRPLLMQYLDRYTREQARRHEVVPGVTGWAQINGRNGLSWEDKFDFDVWYVDNWSLKLDLLILWKTIMKVAISDGISAAGVSTMTEFRGKESSVVSHSPACGDDLG